MLAGSGGRKPCLSPQRNTGRKMAAKGKRVVRDRHENVRARRAREKRVWRAAFAVSALFHVLVFLLGPRGSIPISAAAAGPNQGDIRAADGTMTVMALSSAPPTQIRRPALPIVDVNVAVPVLSTDQPAPEMSLDIPTLSDPGVGSSQGTDPGDVQGAGIPGATGAGDAGTSLEGRSRIIPPSPRGIILPPTNESLRGRRVEIWVFVDERGRVVADSTRLQPPTPDQGFNERLVGEAAEWVFEPARQNGTPIATWFPYTVSME